MKTAKIILVLLLGALFFVSCSGSDDECYDFGFPASEEVGETTELPNPDGGN